MLRTLPRRIALVMAIVVGVFGVLLAPNSGFQGDDTTDPLAKYSTEAGAKYLEKHPEAQLEVLNADPTSVNEWWTKQLGQRDRNDFIKATPFQIGNMDGVDYVSRDKANRIHLKAALATAVRDVKQHSGDAAARTVLQSLQAINHTITGKHSEKRYLVELTNDKPPLAAVAIGNPDTAKQVTFAVPGMGTFTTDMALWTQGAQNLYDRQGWAGAPKDRSVISWIGYVTPPPPPSIDVTEGAFAAKGATKLTAAINGFWASRLSDKKGALPALGIVAHSYGTTTAADALYASDLNVTSFVMLGSAGMDKGIPNAAALHVAHVYAGEAKADQEARLGRLDRVDPRSPQFGATVIGVDGDGHKGVYPVTGHDPVLHSSYNDDAFSADWKGLGSKDKKTAQQTAEQLLDHWSQAGYLDLETESLDNAAIATTPGASKQILTLANASTEAG